MLLDNLLRTKKRVRGGFFTRVTGEAPAFPRGFFPKSPRRVISFNANVPYQIVGLSANSNRPYALPRRASAIPNEDRRLWHPNSITPARSSREFYPVMDEIAPKSVTSYSDPDVWERIHRHRRIDWRPRTMEQLTLAPWWYGFKNADKVYICVKRKIRREIAHALGFAGGPVNAPKFNHYSRVRC